MTDWRRDIDNAVGDFLTVSKLARATLDENAIEIEYLPAPHVQPSLPKGKMAIYGFWHDSHWLKIGFAGPKSNARYTSQHYEPGRANSSLAKSLRDDPDAPKIGAVTDCNRVNILLDADCGVLLLALLEAFLHVRLEPRYEK